MPASYGRAPSSTQAAALAKASAHYDLVVVGSGPAAQVTDLNYCIQATRFRTACWMLTNVTQHHDPSASKLSRHATNNTAVVVDKYEVLDKIMAPTPVLPAAATIVM